MASHASHGQYLRDGRVKVDFSRVHDHYHMVQSNIERNVKSRKAKITFGTHVQKCDRLQPFVGVPRMNIAILITGSRGDVQPFIALGKKLQESSHRVRIGTHSNFRELVRDNGLEFYSIGGDPELLMAYMVKNPGVLPSIESMKAGDVGSRKADLETMLTGAWRACTEACDDYDSKNNTNAHQLRPFVADAIISNPPTYASLHIAERLAIPLHYMFTMPWSPTTAFPHPLAQMDSSRTDAGRRNYLSYTQIELLTWLGLTDIINRFRRRTLLLEPIDPTWGTNLVPRLKVPFTYCWSPALIPKPADWGAHIGVSGFFFLPSGTTYQPDSKLQAFLDAGEPPVYIGFGSIVIDDPETFTKLILDAVAKAGVRALVSKGWSNVGGSDVPENVFLLGNVPHDWLFQHVSAVVHHGGAGTCAIGLALGRPTVIVPFFGDQFWWAGIVHRAGAGPQAVPYKKLTSDNLADNIREALKLETQAKAHELSAKMKGEDGVAVAAEQFHSLQLTQKFACFLCPDRMAVWRVRRTNVQLSAFATAVLTKHGRLQPRDIKLIRHKRWYVDEGAPGPLSGAVASMADTAANCVSDVQDCKRSIKRSRRARAQAAQDEKAALTAGPKPQSIGSAIVQLSRELAVEAVTAPVNFFYQVANGFHNAPSTMMHDRTVRVRDPPITGCKSGLQVAGKEVVFGLYDGVTGLATHPISGYKDGKMRKGGAVWGAAKGAGRGIFGAASRAGAIGFGLPGYTMKGIEMQFRKQGTTMDQLAELPTLPRPTGANTLDKESREKLRVRWAEASAGHPILQRRVLQAISELHDAEEKEPELEAATLERWDALARANSLQTSTL